MLLAVLLLTTMRCYHGLLRSVDRLAISRHHRLCSSSATTSSVPSGGGSVDDLRSRREGLGKPKGYYNDLARYRLENHTLSGLPDTSSPYLVLGIESSCDDTGVSVVRSDGVVLSNVVLSQYSIHERFGGVVPSLAMEAHKANIDIALERALREAGLSSVADVDAIAVTKGPGLEICLRVGIRRAQELARLYAKPFAAVHHLEAHVLVARLLGEGSGIAPARQGGDTAEWRCGRPDASKNDFKPKIDFPFLALLASGGHTSILLCKGYGDYTSLGGTLDDSLGEAFDKAARLLGIHLGNSSGGAAVEKCAREASSTNAFSMKVPMRDKANCDFSYAGLKNAFRVAVVKARESHGLDGSSNNAPAQQMQSVDAESIVSLPENVTADLCATFQNIAFMHVEDRIKRALVYLNDNGIHINSLAVVGGVAANAELRRRLAALLDKADFKREDGGAVTLSYPPPSLCTDNGVMVAWAGVEKFGRGISDSPEGLEALARWPIGNNIADISFSKKGGGK